MSLQALAWAIEDAPDVPKAAVAVLVALANRADEEGRGAFPSVHRLAHAARKSERAVQDDLAKLQELGLIRPGDQRAAYHIEPRYRPTVWDLCMERKRDPYVTPRLQDPEVRTDRKAKEAARGVRKTAPLPDGSRGAENRAAGVRETAPEPSLEQPTYSRERESHVGNARGSELPPNPSSRKGPAPAEAGPPPLRCEQHLSDLAPPPCRACGAAREAHKAWADQQRLRATEAAQRAREVEARARADAEAEVRECALCDATGHMLEGPWLCRHDPERNRLALEARAEMTALRATLETRTESRSRAQRRAAAEKAERMQALERELEAAQERAVAARTTERREQRARAAEAS